MPSNWTKGFTKYTHPSVRKISETMIRKRIDNFSNWREMARKSGILKSSYLIPKKDGNLAELLGVTYGDGNIEKFPRTERLVIAANSLNTGFVKRYADLIECVFQKKPVQIKSKISHCTRLSIYECHISKRLGIPSGDKSNLVVRMPKWIRSNKEHLVRFLRGLFEAEGFFGIHKPTSTYKLIFSNKNDSLLKLVFNGLIVLGFHPHISGYRVQISKKEEVFRAKNLLRFRIY